MKITINFDNEIDFAIQKHLDDGTKVQSFVRAAVHFFTDMYKQEQTGKMIGFGDKARFATYNTETSPRTYLNTEREKE